MTDLERLQSFGKLVDAVGGLRAWRPMEVGWCVNDVLDEALAAEAGQPDAPAPRAVYGLVLDLLADHFAGTSDWDSPQAARARLVDYARVTRFFTRERYENMVSGDQNCSEPPKLGQLRACLVKSSYWWEYPEAEIMERVQWAEQHGWPATAKITEHFASSVCDDELSIDDERWLAFDHARQVAYDKACAYLDATNGSAMTDKTIARRRLEAKSLVNQFMVSFAEADSEAKGR